MSTTTRVGSNACFGGSWQRYKHDSECTKTPMAFSVFVPPAATPEAPAPCIFYLSGLTCTDENFVQKAGAARAAAAERGVARSITGHSMGGAGALTIAMKAPETWTSVSAFSPICNPTRVPWGKKAFEGYLGSVEAGAAHDASELVRKGGPFAFGDILISQGADDDFLVGDVDQLQPEAFRAACDSVGQGLELRYEAGYDHSSFFIATFVDQHVNFHADRLLAR
ncbi:S-formylglutathione hydrolase [Aureococcus anophagefferens]|nr:S-formylglutathione hydrolase [Aureococcus anophagefferens]